MRQLRPPRALCRRLGRGEEGYARDSSSAHPRSRPPAASPISYQNPAEPSTPRHPIRAMQASARERKSRVMTRRPNVLVIMTDQLRYPPSYESDALAEYRRRHLPGVERLRQDGVSFRHHYPMSAACAPSRASLLTGQYPSLHGVTQTDGIAKSADGDDMFWLAPDTVPTLGDWFRAGGYRTYYKGKWHVSHPYLTRTTATGSCCRSMMTAHGSTPTSRVTWMPISSTSTGSRSGSVLTPTDWASTTPARSRTRSPPTRRSRCSSVSTANRARSRG